VTTPSLTTLAADEARASALKLPKPYSSSELQTSHIRRVAIVDTLVIVIAVGLAQILRFGATASSAQLHNSRLTYSLISVVLIVSWELALRIFQARAPRVTGSGAEEYRRIARASLSLFGLVAIVAYLGHLELARGYLIVALPLGLSMLLLSRWRWRKWLIKQREAGLYSSRVLVVGSHQAAVTMAKIFQREPGAGYRVVGVCVPRSSQSPGQRVVIDGQAVPVLGDEHSVFRALELTQADTLAISNTEFLGVEGMRALAWQLEATSVELVVSAGVVDVAGPRLRIRPVAGLPLLHVDKPQFRGANRLAKLAVDLLGASLVLIATVPVTLLAAVAIKCTSRGPLLYKSERIGLNGQSFGMLKFRTMSVVAESRREELMSQNEAAGPLFKMRHDPRVTTVGRWIRRFSIDELPQLFNVLRGQMSIVGPRPPLRSEVVTYSDEVHRRLLVKPGLTGLWQVSGRSDLSWEESVRLDLYYVENWSLVQDLVIVWRTIRAVLSSRGAY
jgi:exopolysaccharide biosynthesis polyprenyl glycosylphosphotransferase